MASNDVMVQEYQEAFAYYDGDRDGKITSDELGYALRALGHSPTESELNAMKKAIERIYGGCKSRRKKVDSYLEAAKSGMKHLYSLLYLNPFF